MPRWKVIALALLVLVCMGVAGRMDYELALQQEAASHHHQQASE